MDTEFERVAVDGAPVSNFDGIVQDRPADEYFLDTCSGCHGADRRGATGPALLPERLSQPDEYYAGVIANGKPGTVMPPFAATPYQLNEDGHRHADRVHPQRHRHAAGVDLRGRRGQPHGVGG